MSKQKKSTETTNNKGLYVSGQLQADTIVVGDDSIVETYKTVHDEVKRQTMITTTPEEVTQADLAELRQLLTDLKAQVAAEAPPEKKDAALEKVGELEEAITAKEPDLMTAGSVKNWFARHIPALVGAVTSIVIHPIVGKLVEAAGDALAVQLHRRLGEDNPA